jgi:type IV pilus assembly protein PilC
MPLFRYSARTSSGEVVQGTQEAPTQADLVTMLREQGLIPTNIESGASGGGAATSSRAKKQAGKGGRIKLGDLVLFSRQLATMIKAGLPLIEVLNILYDQVEKAKFKVVVRQVERDIQGGAAFCEALEKHPKVFDQFFINMVRVGETAGMLDTILEQVAGYLEKTEKLLRKIKSAMIYPAVVSFVAIGITIFLLVYVVPTFEDIFDGFNVELPLPTRMVLYASEKIRIYWYYVTAFILAVYFGVKYYAKTSNGRRNVDKLKLKVPVFGDLILKAAVARFSRTLGTLIRAGINILTALEICAKTAGNKIIEQAVMNCRASIQAGETMTKPLEDSGVFPPMVTRMIEVGEKTGAIDTMLEKVADFYEDQVDAAVDGLTSLIEPMLIVFLGVVIGFIVIAMFMPMFKMIDALSA